MARVKLDAPDPDEFTIVPEGRYAVTVDEITTTGTTKSGDEYWRLRLKITEGPFAGQSIFENIVFAAPDTWLGKRTALAFRALGYDPSAGWFEVQPPDIVGKSAAVQVEHKDGRAGDGEVKTFANVTAKGWFSLQDDGAPADDKGLPF